jgi:hypothetical protein
LIGGGIRQITAGTVDFGATDSPMTEDEVKKAPKIWHVPMTIGAGRPQRARCRRRFKLTPGCSLRSSSARSATGAIRS